MFNKIEIPRDRFGYKLLPEGTSALDDLSKINILIGKNNSGKSRFLRWLFSNDELNFLPFNFPFEEYGQLLNYISTKAAVLYQSRSHPIHDRVLNRTMSIEPLNYLTRNYSFQKVRTELASFHETCRKTGLTFGRDIPTAVLPAVERIINIIEEAGKRHATFKRIYIPTGRGLRPLQFAPSPKENASDDFDSTVDNFHKRCIKDYFRDKKEPPEIFTGLNLYNETKSLLLGKKEERDKIRNFEEFLSVTFFQDQIVNIVPSIQDDSVHIRIGPEEYPIYHLGDGIQSIIILTYPLFFNQGSDCVFFFEEPEIHMHPGLQRIFMDTLQRPAFSTYQTFITTHSNHFLDLTLDYDNISVFTFNKSHTADGPAFVIEKSSYCDKKVLELIGARSSSVFLSNCTIWVEGITDRLYLRRYFEVYQQSQARQFKEDHHYAFVEYGGNNITHWSFLEDEDPEHPNINVDRICSTLFLITDKDGADLNSDGSFPKKATKKHLRHRQLTEKLKDRYYCLECREIENLLDKSVIKQVIIDREGKEQLDFSAFDVKPHKDKRLGEFIERTVPGLKRKYSSQSGSIAGKIEFCRSAINKVNGLTDMSPEAHMICEKLYAFISANNP